MNSFAKVGLLFAASALAFSSVGRAQLQTYETQTAYQGSMFTFYGQPLGQTFTNVSAVAKMTYNFFAGAGGVDVDSQITAVFGEWSGGAFVDGTTVTFDPIVVPAVGSDWTTFTNSYGTFTTYAYEFDLTSFSNNSLIHSEFGYLTDASKTYALMLTPSVGSAVNLSLGLTNTNAFAYGATNIGFNDWVFAQIVVAPGHQDLVPVPESSTVAAMAAAALVAGLVGVRLRQRRSAAETRSVVSEVVAA
jgi:Putative N-acetylmannosamine-6-phosphate epimerase